MRKAIRIISVSAALTAIYLSLEDLLEFFTSVSRLSLVIILVMLFVLFSYYRTGKLGDVVVAVLLLMPVPLLSYLASLLAFAGLGQYLGTSGMIAVTLVIYWLLTVKVFSRKDREQSVQAPPAKKVVGFLVVSFLVYWSASVVVFIRMWRTGGR